MKDILVTGYNRIIKEILWSDLAKDFRVIAADRELPRRNDGNVRFYSISPEEEAFRQLFDVYSFSAIFFISGYVDGGEGFYGEMNDLEKVLLEAAHAHVDKVVILSSIESMNYVPAIGTGGIELDRNFYQAASLRADQLEEMCRFFSKTMSLKTIILRLPYLTNSCNDGNFLGKLFRNIYENKKLLLPYRENDRVDFISQEDLAELLRRIVEEDEDESGSYFVSSGYRHTYGDLAAVLSSLSPGLRILYENKADVMPREDYPFELRKIYGWIPKEDVMEQTAWLYELFCKKVMKGKRSLRDWLEKLLNRQEGIFKYVELLVVFLFAELLNHYLGVNVYFRFVDIRLFFIVIMGTIYGMRTGLLAALLECIALFVQYLGIGVDWTLLFYNVENWIPFMIYLMAGSVTGYIKNKKTEEIKFSREEYGLLRDKYLFLNEVYRSAVENKGEYKKQILGFKDSFGRIFDAVQRLDNILPQSIFMEALLTMEDILENRSIAIYSVDQYERFGRLVVCSDQLRTKLPKSMVLEESGGLFEMVRERKIYKNTEMQEGMPVYASGIFREEKLVLFVVIYEVNPDQYGMNYMNIFRILCGLVQTSFLRALDYEELAEEKIYYPQTNVVRRERFMEILAVQSEMKEKKIADYVLVKLEEKERHKVSDSLSRIIRAADVIGEGTDGNLYVLLTQVNLESFHFVETRLAGTGLSYQVVEKVG